MDVLFFYEDYIMNTIKNFRNLTFALLIGMSFTASVSAFDKPMNHATQQELLEFAMPEHADKGAVLNKSFGPELLCFVDTPAWEIYTGPTCSSTGTAFSTTAAFKVFNLDPTHKVIWSNVGCPAYEPSLCILPIGFIADLTVVATVVNKNTGQVIATLSATADYNREIFR